MAKLRMLRQLLFIASTAAATVFLATSAASAEGLLTWLRNEFGSVQKTAYEQQIASEQSINVVRLPDQVGAGQIIVSFADRRLYYVYAGGYAISYPIATPRPDSRWQAVMKISQKRIDPPWTPTAEMRAQNPRLPEFVPGGHPQNPLGSRALYLGSSLYRIHGTDAPGSIGLPVSRGCIRMHNRHVVDLYNRVALGTKVTVTWASYRHS